MIFRDLALAIIDEQHRFGVAQRLALTAKAKDTHVLVMTATPIPRTLAMTAFGDMDCASTDAKSLPGRRTGCHQSDSVVAGGGSAGEGLSRAMAKGEKVYWICPLVEESDDENLPSDLAAAGHRFSWNSRHRFISKRVALTHGRLTAAERDDAMSGFAGGRYDMLVATTVVEVGVDVPDATIIVIEHAERFGLAPLRKLRGQNGGALTNLPPPSCFIPTAAAEILAGKERLRIICET